MKKIILVIAGIFLFSLVLTANKLKEIRDCYFQVNTEKIELDDYESFIKKNVIDSSIEWKGYQIMTWFLKAKDYYNPINKLEAFNIGKNKLDSLLTTCPRSVELRFLRFTVQDNAPGFLGYNNNLIEDRKFITQQYNTLEDLDLKTRIFNYLKEK